MTVRALILPLILSAIAHPVAPTPRDDPSTFIQDTSPVVDNPRWSMDGDEMFNDSFAIPYLYPSSSSPSSSPPSSLPSSLPSSSSPSSSPSSSSSSVIHGISQSVNPSITPSYAPWKPTPVNTKPTNTETTPTPVHNYDQPTPTLEEKPAPTFEEKPDDDDDDSFSKLWDVLSGRIRNVLDSDEFTLWD